MIWDRWHMGERKALWSHIWRVTGKLFQQIVRHESEFLIQLTMRTRSAQLSWRKPGRWRQERVAKKGTFFTCLLSFVMSLNRSSIKVCLLMKMHSESKSSTITPWAMKPLFFLLDWAPLYFFAWVVHSKSAVAYYLFWKTFDDDGQASEPLSSQIFQRCQIPAMI